MDRIDPEHIFRILNILSAHNSYYGEGNKFAFDKIILVCDIDNIANIYIHKYGSNVDFEGYIDKYFSTEIFKIENQGPLRTYIGNNFHLGNDDYSNFVYFFLHQLAESKTITLRKIKKHQSMMHVPKFEISQQNIRTENIPFARPYWLASEIVKVESADLKILQFFKMTSVVFGKFSSFIEVLNNDTAWRQKIMSVEQVLPVIKFLALQYHISHAVDEQLLFQKVYNQSRTQVDGLVFPKTSALGLQFIIQLTWTNLNPYTPQQSYFTDAEALPGNSDGRSEIPFLEIVKTVRTIAKNLRDREILSRAKLYY